MPSPDVPGSRDHDLVPRELEVVLNPPADDTQSPTQGWDAGPETLDPAARSFAEVADGADRPHGVDGTQSENPRLGLRYVAGSVGGLLVDGPSR